MVYMYSLCERALIDVQYEDRIQFNFSLPGSAYDLFFSLCIVCMMMCMIVVSLVLASARR